MLISYKPLEQWKTYSTTIKKITITSASSGGKAEDIYQCQGLCNLTQAKSFYEAKLQEYCTAITACMKSRLAWSDLTLIRDTITVLATQGWQKCLDEEDCESETDLETEKVDPLEPIARLGVRFKIPLQAAGVDVDKLCEEFYDMLLYATQFLTLSTQEYRAVWWRLFHCPNSSNWSNILTLSRLLFTLPVSNGKLERIFSTLKLIKVDKQASLGSDSLNDLLALNTDSDSMKDFNPDSSIQLWWRAKLRRPDQKKRKEYVKRMAKSKDVMVLDSESDDGQTNSDNEFLLDDWDEWMAN